MDTFGISSRIRDTVSYLRYGANQMVAHIDNFPKLVQRHFLLRGEPSEPIDSVLITSRQIGYNAGDYNLTGSRFDITRAINEAGHSPRHFEVSTQFLRNVDKNGALLPLIIEKEARFGGELWNLEAIYRGGDRKGSLPFHVTLIKNKAITVPASRLGESYQIPLHQKIIVQINRSDEAIAAAYGDLTGHIETKISRWGRKITLTGDAIAQMNGAPHLNKIVLYVPRSPGPIATPNGPAHNLTAAAKKGILGLRMYVPKSGAQILAWGASLLRGGVLPMGIAASLGTLAYFGSNRSKGAV